MHVTTYEFPSFEFFSSLFIRQVNCIALRSFAIDSSIPFPFTDTEDASETEEPSHRLNDEPTEIKEQ